MHGPESELWSRTSEDRAMSHSAQMSHGYMPGTCVLGLMVIMLCHDAMLLQCRCMEITEKGYTAIARGCQKLQVLRMYACAHVNDATLKACGQLLPDLRVIDICGAHLVTDNGAQVSFGCSVKHAVLTVPTVLFCIL